MLGELFQLKNMCHPTVLERYTVATRRALDFARAEAARRGASLATVGDLVAGVSEDEDTRAERVGSLKANAFYLRWLVGLPALPALDSRGGVDAESVELDQDAKRALGYAVLEADRDREYWIDSDHLLRGLLRFPNKADFALLKTEISLESSRIASRLDREKFEPEESSNVKVVEYLVRKWAMLLVPPTVSLACYLYILIQGIGLTASPLAH
jgi:hypothetical protein